METLVSAAAAAAADGDVIDDVTTHSVAIVVVVSPTTSVGNAVVRSTSSSLIIVLINFGVTITFVIIKRGLQKGSPYSITERRVPELILVLGSQPAGDVSHKPGGRLSLLSAVTPATLKRAATNFATW